MFENFLKFLKSKLLIEVFEEYIILNKGEYFVGIVKVYWNIIS